MAHTTRTEAIQREIIDPIESTGIANAADYNLDGIADRVLMGDGGRGWTLAVSADEFWQAVEENEL